MVNRKPRLCFQGVALRYKLLGPATGLAQHRLGGLLSAGTVPATADRPGGAGRREGSQGKRLS
jgi:hypothetical protein